MEFISESVALEGPSKCRVFKESTSEMRLSEENEEEDEDITWE